jgi:hypothetical protein
MLAQRGRFPAGTFRIATASDELLVQAKDGTAIFYRNLTPIGYSRVRPNGLIEHYVQRELVARSRIRSGGRVVEHFVDDMFVGHDVIEGTRIQHFGVNGEFLGEATLRHPGSNNLAGAIFIPLGGRETPRDQDKQGLPSAQPVAPAKLFIPLNEVKPSHDTPDGTTARPTGAAKFIPLHDLREGPTARPTGAAKFIPLHDLREFKRS